MNDKEIDVLKMLFAEHHRQLAEKRQKIHGVAEKTLAVFLIITGWLILTKEPLTPGVRWVIIIVAIVLAGGACRSIYTNNRSYHAIARVVGRINEALGLYEGGELSIYPDEWKDFGKRGEFKGAFFHI
jgi:hypothetical protein